MKRDLVVGAGPVGLTMACELARFGLPAPAGGWGKAASYLLALAPGAA